LGGFRLVVPSGREEWRRYAAPAAFLLAVTVAVFLIRAGVESGHRHSGDTPTVQTPTASAMPPRTSPTTTSSTLPAVGQTSVPRYWTVRPGDTFGVIAAQTGVSVARIQELNPTASSNLLHVGQKIRLQ